MITKIAEEFSSAIFIYEHFVNTSIKALQRHFIYGIIKIAQKGKLETPFVPQKLKTIERKMKNNGKKTLHLSHRQQDECNLHDGRHSNRRS